MVPLARPTHHHKRYLDRVSRFYTVHARFGQSDRTTTELELYNEEAVYAVGRACDAA